MLMMWEIQQAKRDDAIRAAECHSAFIAVTALNVQMAKFSSLLTEISVGKTEILREPSQSPSHMNTPKILQRI